MFSVIRAIGWARGGKWIVGVDSVSGFAHTYYQLVSNEDQRAYDHFIDGT
jgi:hypothetical protein